MPQRPTVSEIEASIGRFSAYQTTAGAGQNISLHKKPAQQLLQAQNCGHGHDLSHHANGGEPPYLTDATIHAFDSSGARLTISGERLTRLKASAKTYINADIMSEESYHQALGNISGQSKEIDNVTGKYWQNMAVGVCHAQIIDLFVEQQKDANGQAISKPRTGTIENEEPGVLLLSSPALNEAYGVGNRLSPADKEKYIEGMFRNLFNATQSEGRQHIALPPAGLGVFGGNPETYFNALNKVAKEFPDLSIYYNPAQNGQKFNALAAERPTNVHKTDKDVVFLASELSRNGYPCALHNPSDADVVFGMYDPGEYWKTGKGANYVGEEHIGAMSTAPLNGRLMNPGAYNITIVNHFTQQVEEQQLFQPQQSQQSQQSQQAIHSTSGIGTIPLQVSRNYHTPTPIHRIKQQKKHTIYHLT